MRRYLRIRMSNLLSSPLVKTLAARRAEIGLFLLCLFLFFWRLGDARLFDLDEGVYVSSARNMAKYGDFVTPKLNTRPHDRPSQTLTPFFEKPILVYWLSAASMRAFGITAGAARLPVAIASLLTTFVVVILGWRWFGRRAGLLAGLVYATVPMTIVDARQMTTDALLVLWFLAATIGFVEDWPLLFWTACALAVLTKGAIGLLLPGLIVGCFYAMLRLLARWRRLVFAPLFRPRRGRAVSHALGALLFLCIVMPWHIAILRVGGRDLNGKTWFQEYIIYQHVGRSKGADIHHNAIFLVYIPYFLIGFFPWACFAPFALAQTRRDAEAPGADGKRRQGPSLNFGSRYSYASTTPRAGIASRLPPSSRPPKDAGEEEPSGPGAPPEDGAAQSLPGVPAHEEPTRDATPRPPIAPAHEEPAGRTTSGLPGAPTRGRMASGAATTPPGEAENEPPASGLSTTPPREAENEPPASVVVTSPPDEYGSAEPAGGATPILAHASALPRSDGDWRPPTATLILFLKCWFWTIVLFFSVLISAKLPTYIVPVYPAIALLAGLWLERQLVPLDRFRLSKGLEQGAHAILVTALLLVAAALLLPLFTRNRHVMPPAAAALAVQLTLLLAAGCFAAWLCLIRTPLSAASLRAGILTLAATMALATAYFAGPGYAVLNRWIFGPYQVSRDDRPPRRRPRSAYHLLRVRRPPAEHALLRPGLLAAGAQGDASPALALPLRRPAAPGRRRHHPPRDLRERAETGAGRRRLAHRPPRHPRQRHRSLVPLPRAAEVGRRQSAFGIRRGPKEIFRK